MPKVIKEGNDIQVGYTIKLKKDMNEKKIDIDYIKEELDKVVKTLKPDSVFGYGSLYDIATHFYKLGIKDSQK